MINKAIGCIGVARGGQGATSPEISSISFHFVLLGAVMKHYESVEFLSIFRMSSPIAQTQSPHRAADTYLTERFVTALETEPQVYRRILNTICSLGTTLLYCKVER